MAYQDSSQFARKKTRRAQTAPVTSRCGAEDGRSPLLDVPQSFGLRLGGPRPVSTLCTKELVIFMRSMKLFAACSFGRYTLRYCFWGAPRLWQVYLLAKQESRFLLNMIFKHTERPYEEDLLEFTSGKQCQLSVRPQSRS